MHMLDSLRIKAKKTTVLDKLRQNRASHAAIVVEARVGYVEKAQTAIAAKLDELKSGKVVALRFSLEVPLDYTSVYDTAIRMLELHQEEEIVLDAGQVRNLMEDKWDWTRQFYGSTVAYSKRAEDQMERLASSLEG